MCDKCQVTVSVPPMSVGQCQRDKCQCYQYQRDSVSVTNVSVTVSLPPMSVSPVSHVCVTGSVSPFQCQGDKCQCHQCHVSVSQGQCPQCHSVTASVSQCVRVTVSVYPVPQCHHVSVTVSVSSVSQCQCHICQCPQCHSVTTSVSQCHVPSVTVSVSVSVSQCVSVTGSVSHVPCPQSSASPRATVRRGHLVVALPCHSQPCSVTPPAPRDCHRGPPPWDTQCHLHGTPSATTSWEKGLGSGFWDPSVSPHSPENVTFGDTLEAEEFRNSHLQLGIPRVRMGTRPGATPELVSSCPQNSGNLEKGTQSRLAAQGWMGTRNGNSIHGKKFLELQVSQNDIWKS